MITRDEAIDIVRKKIPEDSKLAYVVEDDIAYEFKVFSQEDLNLDTFSNSFCCSVDKETGEVENSAMLQYYQLFDPEKYNNVLKTMMVIDDTNRDSK